MSIHIESALHGIVSRVVLDCNRESPAYSGKTIKRDDYRPFVEAVVAAETSELRRQIAELKLANMELTVENARLKGANP